MTEAPERKQKTTPYEELESEWVSLMTEPDQDAFLSQETRRCADLPAAVTVKPCLDYFQGFEDGREASASMIERCNREGPYEVIGAADRIREIPTPPHKSGYFPPAPVAGWRGMDSAPKDGTEVLCWVLGDVHKMAFEDDDWWDCHKGSIVGSPEAWMPLPPAPGEQPVAAQPDAVQEAARDPKPDHYRVIKFIGAAEQAAYQAGWYEGIALLRALKGDE